MALCGAAVLAISGCGRLEQAQAPVAPESPVAGADFRPHVEFVTEGAIDWGNARYLARVSVPVPRFTAAGEPLPVTLAESRALDAASITAARVALTLAAGIRVDARDTLGNLAADSGTLMLWGHVRGRRLLEKRRLRSGDLQAVYEVPMLGVDGVVSRLYEKKLRRLGEAVWNGDTKRSFSCPHSRRVPGSFESRYLPPCLRASVVKAFWTAPPFALLGSSDALPGLGMHFVLQRPKDSVGEGTSPAVVIDARGTGLNAALFPVVKDERGNVVYSLASASRRAVVGEGLVQYVELPPGCAVHADRDDGELASLPAGAVLFPDGGGLEAGEDTEVKPKPKRRRRRRRVVLKAKEADGPLRANVIVSSEDAKRLAAEKGSLAEARVIIVTDTSVGGVEGMLRGGRFLAAR